MCYVLVLTLEIKKESSEHQWNIVVIGFLDQNAYSFLSKLLTEVAFSPDDSNIP